MKSHNSIGRQVTHAMISDNDYRSGWVSPAQFQLKLRTLSARPTKNRHQTVESVGAGLAEKFLFDGVGRAAQAFHK